MCVPALGLLLAALATPSAEEMDLLHRWVAAHLGGAPPPPLEAPYLEVRANYGVVTRNGVGERLFQLRGLESRSGLYCHGPSEILVHLPGPARSFHSRVGVDSNYMTSGGRGSVCFRVRADGEERHATRILREGMPPEALDVDLGGATELALLVDNAEDGIACDQADWVEARIEMADGSTVHLGELPLIDRRASGEGTSLPFSFRYRGSESSELLATWPRSESTVDLDAHRTERTLTWRDPATGLEVRLATVVYRDFPTVEWTLWLRNGGAEDTPVISEIQAADVLLARDEGEEFVLHHNTGSPCTARDYEPFDEVLGPGTTRAIATEGGRSTNTALPYFRVSRPGGHVSLALGWPGQWAARFIREGSLGLRVEAGQELVHFVLHPGEEVRGPLTVLQFSTGGADRARNLWRRWMLAHSTPQVAGASPRPMLGAVSGNHFPGLLCDREGELAFLERMRAERLPFDWWWMDAGWYPNKGDWGSTGTWKVDRARFPGGLLEISDLVASRGKGLLVWFEPERVTPGSELYEGHPEWLLGPDGGTKLLDLGNDEARAWLIERIDSILTDEGIGFYRQDFNMDPLDYWRGNDAPNRQGITEIRHVMGYLAFWDELRRRHPDMLIDSCASGGRRNDIETLRRAVPLLRSDWVFDPVANQCHTYGMAEWMPYQGTGFIDFDPWILRSCYTPWFTLGPDFRRDDLDYPMLRELLAEWQSVSATLLGDWYPLTAWSASDDAWMVWQFDLPERGEGIVQAFRRAESPWEVGRFRLKGLDPEATYRIEDADSAAVERLNGRELMDQGLRLEIEPGPTAKLLRYRKGD